MSTNGTPTMVELECIYLGGSYAAFEVAPGRSLDFTNGRAQISQERLDALQQKDSFKRLWGREIGLLGTLTGAAKANPVKVIRATDNLEALRRELAVNQGAPPTALDDHPFLDEHQKPKFELTDDDKRKIEEQLKEDEEDLKATVGAGATLGDKKSKGRK